MNVTLYSGGIFADEIKDLNTRAQKTNTNIKEKSEEIQFSYLSFEIFMAILAVYWNWLVPAYRSWLCISSHLGSLRSTMMGVSTT